MIILPIPTTSLIHFSVEGREMYFSNSKLHCSVTQQFIGPSQVSVQNLKSYRDIAVDVHLDGSESRGTQNVCQEDKAKNAR